MSKLVAERYSVEEELGSGGMGTVYKGLDTQTNQTVAIKQLHPKLSDEQLIERFKREGEALRDLNHPNIVKMLDAVEEDNQHYLIMEYVSGSDLANLITQEKLTLEKILNLSIDLADALTRAHRLDIIHRDLKPANILIGEDGILRLTDFGVAHIGSKERVTDIDALVGTIDYLPPEAFDNASEFDERGDIWAFGVILCELLTEERPFTGTSVIEVMLNIVQADVPNLEELRPDIPLPLIDLIYRMLEKDPLARMTSIRHVGASLEDILQGRNDSPSETRFDTPLPEILIYQAPKHNLPLQTTPFVGRESELSELAKLLRDTDLRLMTILAPGGMGKTRLALEIAQQIIESLDVEVSDTANLRFTDGAFFVELAPLTHPDAIVPAIAHATGYQFQEDGREHKQQVLDFLRNKHLLLVMDNFEHLMDGTALVAEILQTALNVQILVTSRQRLGQTGEALFHLAGMDFPDWETPEDALDYAAVKLFINSARRAQPGWELTVDNLDSVARICRLVQGMPLGIVLAAAWLAMLSETEIISELEESIDILADDSGALPERQQSIRGVMDYSWQMMNEAEQSVFMKLAIFQDGFTREAVQEITGATLRILMSLVNKSLIRRNANSGRYRLHELLRQYALEKLENSEIEQETRTTHSQYFLEYAGAIGLEFLETFSHPMLEIDEDYDNIILAWYNAIERDDIATIERGLDMFFYFAIRLRHRDSVNLFSAVFEIIPQDNTILRAKLMVVLSGSLARVGEREKTFAYMMQSLEILKDIEDAKNYYMMAKLVQALFRQFTHSLDESIVAIEVVAKEGTGTLSRLATQTLAFARLNKGQVDESEQEIRELLEEERTTYQSFGMTRLQLQLGEIASFRGDYDKANVHLLEVLSIGVKRNTIQSVIDTNVVMAQVAFFQGDYQKTQQHLNEVDRIIERIGIDPLRNSSVTDAVALRSRLYLYEGEKEACRDLLSKLVQLPFSIMTLAGFVIVSVVDYLIHDGQKEWAMLLSYYILTQPINLSVRKSAMLMIENLQNQGIETPDEEAVAGIEFQSLMDELRGELPESE